MTGPSGARVTHRTRLLMLPLSDLRGTESSLGVIPVMIVNPSMENVVLVPDGGRWRPQMHGLRRHGHGPTRARAAAVQAITGATARLADTAATITLQMPAPSDAYECALTEGDAPFAREIADQSGIMLAVTYAADLSPTTWPASSATRCATRGCCAAGSPSSAAADGRIENTPSRSPESGEPARARPA